MTKNTYWIKVVVTMHDGELKENGFGYWHDATQWIDGLTEGDVLPFVVCMTMELGERRNGL